MSVASDRRASSGAESARFLWDDALLLDDQLSDDERLIRDTARDFAQEKLLPGVVEAYAKETTDPAIFAAMGELGLLGVTIPEEFGGAEASYVAYGLVAREVERVDSGYRSMMSVQSSLVMFPIYTYGERCATPENICRSSPAVNGWAVSGLTEPERRLRPPAA